MSDKVAPDTSRLALILAEIDKQAPSPASGEPTNISDLLAEVQKAAKLLIELYGMEALERARTLEVRSTTPSFARRVREAVETQLQKTV